MSNPVVVSHSRGSYPVYVEPGILTRLDQLAADLLPHRRVALIADAAVNELFRTGRPPVMSWTGETFTVPPGEGSKSRETWARLTDELLERVYGRDSGVIGLGGGVVGDLAGFVAATYMRGLPYILAPTTLLAMLDASVGGKTGVNAPKGKNLIGAFHQPSAVLSDPIALATLPEREYRGGLAEAVKHGLIADSVYFAWIETHAPAILRRDLETVTHLIRQSAEIKARIVSEDERESGRRAILNAGHTVAHALEHASNYQLTHGEAVALGLVAECGIAERIGAAPPGLRERVAGLLQSLGLPVRLHRPLDRQALVSSMAMDKKNRAERIHFALPSSPGEMYQRNGWTTPIATSDIQTELSALE